MKHVRTILTLAFALAVLMSVGVMTAAADQPGGADVAQVAYLDNATHNIGANASQLYRFDYALKDDGSRPLVTITMPNATDSGLGFVIMTADQLRAQAASAVDGPTSKLDNNITGRGSAANINCDTGVLNGGGACKTADLVWTGSFGSSGPYFVSITNNSGSGKSFQLNIKGSTVTLALQTQLAAASQTNSAAAAQTKPAAAPALAATAGSPDKAIALDAQQHTIAAQTSTWYKFDYALKSDGSRPTMTIRMPNGTNSGIGFNIWTADQLAARANNAADARLDNTHNDPIGMGTAQRVNCDTGAVSGSGACWSPDLLWTGTFGSSGTYYVEVVNGNASDGSYQLMLGQ